MAATEVLPDTGNHDSAGFWAAAREHRLTVQTCASCGTARFPPRPYCGACRSAESRFTDVSGYGRVWTYAFVYKPILPAFAEFTPYPVAYIELEDHPGLRMPGNLVAAEGAAINSVPQDRIHVGLRVKAMFEQVADDVALPRWIPVGEGG